MQLRGRILVNTTVSCVQNVDVGIDLWYWYWQLEYHPYLCHTDALKKKKYLKRALKAKRHNCGHRDIISWYAGSMWQRNVGKKYYVWKLFILMSLGAL